MSDWVAPEVFVGDMVLWHDGRNITPRPFPALVVGTGIGGIVDLHVFAPMAYNGFPRSGVRYYDDPDKRAISNSEEGVWSMTERMKMPAGAFVSEEYGKKKGK